VVEWLVVEWLVRELPPCPLTQNSKLKTQNSKLKTQNSKLKTQNSKLFLAKPSQGEETKAALMAMGDRFFLGMGNLCGCHQ